MRGLGFLKLIKNRNICRDDRIYIQARTRARNSLDGPPFLQLASCLLYFSFTAPKVNSGENGRFERSAGCNQVVLFAQRFFSALTRGWIMQRLGAPHFHIYFVNQRDDSKNKLFFEQVNQKQLYSVCPIDLRYIRTNILMRVNLIYKTCSLTLIRCNLIEKNDTHLIERAAVVE